jgi:hypothetical protein
MGDVVLAVDFGTSFTSAAIVADGVVQPVTERYGDSPSWPSVVYHDRRTGTLLVGAVAEEERQNDPAGPLASAEFNRIRVAVGQHFSTIDDLYFRDRIRRLYARIAEVLRRHSGVLMGSEPITPASAEEALGRLSNLLRSG